MHARALSGALFTTIFRRIYNPANTARRSSINTASMIFSICRFAQDSPGVVAEFVGDPLRTSGYAFGQNGQLGFPVAKKVDFGAT